MNRVAMVIGALVLVALVGGGAFWGGMNVGKTQAQDEQTAFFRNRGIDPSTVPGGGAGLPPGAFPGGGGPPAGFPGAGDGNTLIPGGSGTGTGGQGGRANRGAIGTITKIEGNTITVTTVQSGTETINITDSTPIIKTVLGSKADLVVGGRILAVGERSGTNVAATQITITDRPPGVADPFVPPTPTPAK